MLKSFGYLLIVCGLLGAAPIPVIKTTVEEGQEIVPGDIVVFDAGETLEASGFKWAVLPAKFADNRPTNEISLDGKSLRLASRPGQYLIILAVTNKDSEISLVKRDVIVGKPAPGPNPIPPGPINPEPLPAPKFPNEEMGMSTAAYQAAITGTYDKVKLKALAQAFKQIGGAATAGGFNSLKEIELASVEANRKAICGTVDPVSAEGVAIRNSFLPFFTALQPKIKVLSQDKAATPAGYGKMLIEIANGTEAGAK
mgnify:CR=1 FL=1